MQKELLQELEELEEMLALRLQSAESTPGTFQAVAKDLDDEMDGFDPVSAIEPVQDQLTAETAPLPVEKPALGSLRLSNGKLQKMTPIGWLDTVVLDPPANFVTPDKTPLGSVLLAKPESLRAAEVDPPNLPAQHANVDIPAPALPSLFGGQSNGVSLHLTFPSIFAQELLTSC